MVDYPTQALGTLQKQQSEKKKDKETDALTKVEKDASNPRNSN